MEIPVINCKVGFKTKSTKYCILALSGTKHAGFNSNNTIFTIKVTIFYYTIVIYQRKPAKNFQNFLSKGFKDYYIGRNIKQKVKLKKRKASAYISKLYRH